MTMTLDKTNFTVYERTLGFFPPDGRKQPIKFDGYKALIRANEDYRGQEGVQITPRVLSVVRDSYRVMQNKDLFNAVTREMCKAFGDNAVADAKLVERVADHGGWCMWDVTFPTIKREVRNSEVALRSIVINSFDGSTSVRCYNGAIDFFCTNGMVRGEYEHAVFRHNSDTILDRFADRLKATIGTFDAHMLVLREWGDISITPGDVNNWCTKLVYNGKLTHAKSTAIFARFMEEAKVRGFNVWALYSALTHLSTHSEGTVFAPRGDAAARPRLAFKREQDVMQLTNTARWWEVKEAA